ncbi:MAG: hypothetical protein HZC48_01665 [Nitrospirae bacterium]|nr:hypothetical protein [Nitrospirota bacterium]
MQNKTGGMPRVKGMSGIQGEVVCKEMLSQTKATLKHRAREIQIDEEELQKLAG